MRHDRFRRDGTPYSDDDAGLFEWANDLKDHARKVVRQEKLPNGYWVSTVWLGLNHQFGDGPPLIFETMVLNPKQEWEDYQERYSTEDDAIIGHLRAVDLYTSRGRK